ncbi:3-oxo-tetronate kinase [Acerihabitans sp. KWT182]|uniref:3-oxo-tetronate kinase n=1 Tax=Acerihabitans sp. KWT182 TaxID=3157919 RepID=A0AAU7QBM0_9GAMM
MRLGIIADDFTGATDIAGFLVENGLSTVQLNGVLAPGFSVDTEAAVVSLKTRSCPAPQAVAESLAALRWLRARGCSQFFFKYCSTFDSTDRGNIGPVTDALLAALGQEQTVIAPALPVNGRTVYQGYLFVMDQLLSESGMRHHPVTPMTDSNLIRLMESQADGRCGLIPAAVMDRGAAAVRERLAALRDEGIRYVVLDALHEQHLLTQGEALRDMPLVTGGSGLAIGLARQWLKTAQAAHGPGTPPAQAAGAPQGRLCVVLSGSCSTMTQRQVARYSGQAPTVHVDAARCLEDAEGYALELARWVENHAGGELAPLVSATAEPETLQHIQRQWGADNSSRAIERLFAAVAMALRQRGFQRFIVAGGETSGVVTQALGIAAFHIGPVISPGVPWVRSTDHAISLALKSGNFGDENFFARAQTAFPV